MADTFLLDHLYDLSDFWGRRRAETPHHLHYAAYGYPVTLVTNDPTILDAACLSAGRYSRSQAVVDPGTIALTIIQDDRRRAAAVTPAWPQQLSYQAIGDWMMIDGAPWVTAVADVGAQRGAAWISPALAAAPTYLSRYVLDTMTLNALIHTGIGQLHASALYRDGRAVLLSAPHNTGKSTTAFRLVRNGYRLLADGMTYVRVFPPGAVGHRPERIEPSPGCGRFLPRNGDFATAPPAVELLGYPVGEVKLRMDVLDAFPELRGAGRAVLVREDAKMIFNLREAMPDRVVETGVVPEEIVLCLLARHDAAGTLVEPIAFEIALAGLWPDAAHYDDRQVLAGNLAALRTLLGQARCYRLTIGHDPDQIIRTIEKL